MTTENLIRLIQSQGDIVSHGHWKMFYLFPKDSAYYAGNHSRCIQYVAINGKDCIFVDGVQVTDYKLLLTALLS